MKWMKSINPHTFSPHISIIDHSDSRHNDLLLCHIVTDRNPLSSKSMAPFVESTFSVRSFDCPVAVRPRIASSAYSWPVLRIHKPRSGRIPVQHYQLVSSEPYGSCWCDTSIWSSKQSCERNTNLAPVPASSWINLLIPVIFIVALLIAIAWFVQCHWTTRWWRRCFAARVLESYLPRLERLSHGATYSELSALSESAVHSVTPVTSYVAFEWSSGCITTAQRWALPAVWH